MENYTVTMNTIIIWMLWLAGLSVIVFDIVWLESNDVGHLGLAFVAGAVIRHMCCLAKRLERREQRAFDLGRAAGVRSVH